MSPPVKFNDGVFIVTGAGRPTGLGCAHAKMLASHGARVVVNDVMDASDVVADIEAGGGKAVADGHDISTDDGARGLVQSALDAFGQLDGVVNNASVVPVFSFPEMPWDAFDQTIKVHLYGSYFVTKYAWPHLIGSGHGRVVMISSSAALWAWSRNLSHYGAAKAALLGLTRQLALEGDAHGIRVNALFPGALTRVENLAGPMAIHARTYAERLGVDPSDIDEISERSTARVAAVVAWLCHPDCTISGEFFNAKAPQAHRLFVSESLGIKDPNLTVEDVRDQFETIMDPTDALIMPAYVSGGLLANAEPELQVRSSLFSDGDDIPLSAAHHMVGGGNVSPHLSWSAGPEGTKSYAVICYDPDAPTTVGFSHWVRFGIPAEVGELSAGNLNAGKDGFSDWGEPRYGGMAPPPGDTPHRYQFTVFALDAEDLGVDEATTYAKFRFLIRDHVLAQGTLTGHFALGESA